MPELTTGSAPSEQAIRSSTLASRFIRNLLPLAMAGFVGMAVTLVYVFMTQTPAPGVPHLFDFHSFWQAGHDYARGRDPYPARIAGPSVWFVYPAPVAVAMVPLGVLPYAVAWVVFGVILLAAVVGSLWLVGVRDWRCYAIVFCSFPVLKAVNLGTVTPLLMLGAAATWKFRDRRGLVAVAVAATVVTKLFLWPLVPWLWFTGRRRAAIEGVLVGAVVTAAAWLPLGSSSMLRYPSLLQQLAKAESGSGYGLASLSLGLGASQHIAALVPTLVMPLAIVAAWAATRALPDARSLALMIAIAIAISPVVWGHYFALAFICIALLSPTLSFLWLLPLGYWLTTSQGADGSFWSCAYALALLVACAWPVPRASAFLRLRLEKRTPTPSREQPALVE